MRLIDGDKLIEAIDKWQDTLSLETTAIDCVICDVLDSVVMIIDDMDTVDMNVLAMDSITYIRDMEQDGIEEEKE